MELELERVHLDARAHGGVQDQRLHVGALRSGRLGAVDGANQGVEVLNELIRGEGLLADRAVDDRLLVQTIYPSQNEAALSYLRYPNKSLILPEHYS